jgi:serine/threonine-protein kinase
MSGSTAEWGQRAVAVKVFDPLTYEARERLTAVAGAAACICDPHVVQVYDYDLRCETPYVVSELVDGCTLEGLLIEYSRAALPFPHDVGILIGLKVAEGLAAALDAKSPVESALGLVHGRLATRDVLVSWTGEVKVSDFGMGVAPTLSSAVHPMGVISPRLASIAPDLLHGAPPDARSDVFSLGMILFEMLVGPRFPAGMRTSDAMRMLSEGRVPPSIIEPQLVGPVRRILKNCADRDPNRRYQHARAVADELRRIAFLLGIPDVPAFIAQAVAGVCVPEVRELDGFDAALVEVLPDSVLELVPDADPTLEDLDFGPTVADNDD